MCTSLNGKNTLIWILLLIFILFPLRQIQIKADRHAQHHQRQHSSWSFFHSNFTKIARKSSLALYRSLCRYFVSRKTLFWSSCLNLTLRRPSRCLCVIYFGIHYQTKSEGSNLYGKENSGYPILQTYEEGGVMEVKVVFSTYHWVRERYCNFRSSSEVYFIRYAQRTVCMRSPLAINSVILYIDTYIVVLR